MEGRSIGEGGWAKGWLKVFIGLCFSNFFSNSDTCESNPRDILNNNFRKFQSDLYLMERWVDLFPKYSDLLHTCLLGLRKLSSVTVLLHSVFRAPWAISPTVTSSCAEPTCLFSDGQRKVDFPAGWANSHLLGWNRADWKHGICHFVYHQEATNEIQGPFRTTTPYESDSWEEGNPKLETLNSLEGHFIYLRVP